MNSFQYAPGAGIGQGPNGPVAPSPHLGYDAQRAMSGDRPSFSPRDLYMTPPGGSGRVIKVSDDSSSGHGSTRQGSKQDTVRFHAHKLTWRRTKAKGFSSWVLVSDDKLDKTQKQLKKTAEKAKQDAEKLLKGEGMSGQKRYDVEELRREYRRNADAGAEVKVVSIEHGDLERGRTRTGEIYEKATIKVIFKERRLSTDLNYDDACSYSSGSDRQSLPQPPQYQSPTSPMMPEPPMAPGFPGANIGTFPPRAPGPPQHPSASYGPSHGSMQTGPRTPQYPTNNPAQGYDASHRTPWAQGPSASTQRPAQNISQNPGPRYPDMQGGFAGQYGQISKDHSHLYGETKAPQLAPIQKGPNVIIDVTKEKSRGPTGHTGSGGIIDVTKEKSKAAKLDYDERYEPKSGSRQAKEPLVHQSTEDCYRYAKAKKNEYVPKSSKKVETWKDRASSESGSDISGDWDRDSLNDADTPPSSLPPQSPRDHYTRGEYILKPEKSGSRQSGRRDSNRLPSRPEYEVHDRRRDSFLDKRRSSGYTSAHGGARILKDSSKRWSGASYRSRSDSDCEWVRPPSRYDARQGYSPERPRRDSYLGYDARDGFPTSSSERKRYSGSGLHRQSAAYHSDDRESDTEKARHRHRKVLAGLDADLRSADHQLAAQREIAELHEIGRKKGMLLAKLDELSAQKAYRKPLRGLDYVPSMGSLGSGRRRFGNEDVERLSALIGDLDL